MLSSNVDIKNIKITLFSNNKVPFLPATFYDDSSKLVSSRNEHLTIAENVNKLKYLTPELCGCAYVLKSLLMCVNIHTVLIYDYADARIARFICKQSSYLDTTIKPTPHQNSKH